MRKVFIDSGAFIALAYHADQYHEQAVSALQQLATYPFVTTDHVVGETFTWLRYKVGHAAARAFLQQIDTVSSNGQLTIVYAKPTLYRATSLILNRFVDHNLSFTDGLSLAVLESDKSLTDIFAFDADLALAGRVLHPGILG